MARKYLQAQPCGCVCACVCAYVCVCVQYYVSILVGINTSRIPSLEDKEGRTLYGIYNINMIIVYTMIICLPTSEFVYEPIKEETMHYCKVEI